MISVLEPCLIAQCQLPVPNQNQKRGCRDRYRFVSEVPVANTLVSSFEGQRRAREQRLCKAERIKERLLGCLRFLGGRRLGHLLGQVGREGVKSVLVGSRLSTVIPPRSVTSPIPHLHR